MATEIVRKRTITIEETETLRELPGAVPATDIYHWLSEHIVGVTLVALAALAGISFIVEGVIHLYHLIIG